MVLSSGSRLDIQECGVTRSEEGEGNLHGHAELYRKVWSSAGGRDAENRVYEQLTAHIARKLLAQKMGKPPLP